MIQSKEHQSESQPEVKDCEEKDTPTQKSINTERDKYCDLLYNSAGNVATWEESFEEQKKLYQVKKCLFVDVEKNYRILRNFNITIGSEFTQTNDTIKNNITQYIATNKELSDTLQNIAKQVGTLKTCMSELRDQACKLEACRDDSCNTIQWNLLIGKTENKNTKSQSKTVKSPECTDLCEEYFNNLVCIPKSLATDIDSIFKVSAEVKGIHVFSSLSYLESIRSKLADSAQRLNDLIQNKMQLRESDLKKIQEEFTQIIKDSAKSNITLYDARSIFEGVKDAVTFMCCPEGECGCVKDEMCEPRLKDCEIEICEICKKVKKIYCPEKNQNCNDQSKEADINH